MLAGDGKTKVATFASFEDSLRSFSVMSGAIVQGKADPVAFALALQNSRKFGINTATGKKMPTYVKDVAGTIEGLRPIVARA